MKFSYSQLSSAASRLGVSPSVLRRCARVKRIEECSFTTCDAVDIPTKNKLGIFPQWAHQASLYVHWPYCEKRCTYCNFNKYISRNVDHVQMKACLVKETETLLKLSQVSEVTSVFFGGGTPSLAMPDTIEAVLNALSHTTNLKPGAEITIEANPTSTEMQKLRDFRAAGINRLSLGLQALRDDDLQVLGRQHSAAEALRCLEMAHQIYPGRVSVDVIFGRPGQTPHDWEIELKEVLQVCDSHVSLYQLTLERGTALWKQVTGGSLTLPDPQRMADMYEIAVQLLEGSERLRYEASNFARKGSESTHNQSYWHGDQYIGIGPGSHGRFVPRQMGLSEREARIQTLEPDPWMWEVKKYGHGTRKIVPQTTADILMEYLMSGLRTREGITNKRWQEFGANESLKELFGDQPKVVQLQDDGFMEFVDSGLRATAKGLNVIDSITPYLINLLENK